MSTIPEPECFYTVPLTCLFAPLARRSFKNDFANVIDRARNPRASDRERVEGERVNNSLQRSIRPFIIAREKESIFKDVLPPKRELVIWVELSQEQRRMYKEYVMSRDVIDLVENKVSSSEAVPYNEQYLSNSSLRSSQVKKSPLLACTYLKNLSSHPLLLTKAEEYESKLSVTPNEALLAGSYKLEVLKTLVERLMGSKFRVIIFSQSVKMIQIILRVLPTSTLCITGSTPQKERQSIIDRFNSGFGSIMVLSTKVSDSRLR